MKMTAENAVRTRPRYIFGLCGKDPASHLAAELSPPNLPLILEAITGESTGGGIEVVICRTAEELECAAAYVGVWARVAVEGAIRKPSTSSPEYWAKLKARPGSSMSDCLIVARQAGRHDGGMIWLRTKRAYFASIPPFYPQRCATNEFTG
jgi:hypothetical protein